MALKDEGLAALNQKRGIKIEELRDVKLLIKHDLIL